MAEGDILGYGDVDAKRIGHVVEFVEHDPRYRRRVRKYGGPAVGNPIVSGRLTSTLSVATNSLTGPSSFTFRKFVPGDPGGEWTEDDEDTTGYNRSLVMSAASGNYVICAQEGGEWHPIHVDEACS